MRKGKLLLPILIMLTSVIAVHEISPVSAQTRILYGTVYSASTGQPLPATVTVSSCGHMQSTSTQPDGSWQIMFPYGTSGKIMFTAAGYTSQAFQIGSNAQWFEAGGIVSLHPSA